MVFGWAPWWIAQTEWTSFLTQGEVKIGKSSQAIVDLAAGLGGHRRDLGHPIRNQAMKGQGEVERHGGGAVEMIGEQREARGSAPISKVVRSGCSLKHLSKTTTDGGSRAAIVSL